MRRVTYSDLIEAYAGGKTVEFTDSSLADYGWYTLGADNTTVLPYFMRTDGNTEGRFQFRLKPRTVKIGSREVEAPVLEPVEGQLVYWTAASGTENSSRFAHDEIMVDRARAGRLFASEDAARAAHEAIAALLRGEA